MLRGAAGPVKAPSPGSTMPYTLDGLEKIPTYKKQSYFKPLRGMSWQRFVIEVAR